MMGAMDDVCRMVGQVGGALVVAGGVVAGVCAAAALEAVDAAAGVVVAVVSRGR